MIQFLGGRPRCGRSQTDLSQLQDDTARRGGWPAYCCDSTIAISITWLRRILNHSYHYQSCVTLATRTRKKGTPATAYLRKSGVAEGQHLDSSTQYKHKTDRNQRHDEKTRHQDTNRHKDRRKWRADTGTETGDEDTQGQKEIAN